MPRHLYRAPSLALAGAVLAGGIAAGVVVAPAPTAGRPATAPPVAPAGAPVATAIGDPPRPAGAGRTAAGTSRGPGSTGGCRAPRRPRPTGTALPPGAPRPYACPVPGPVASAFDAPATRWSAGHRGVDLVSRVGEPVRSPAAGRLAFAGVVAGRPVVTIDHGGGWRTSMEPVRATVPVGTVLARGGVVGTLDAAAGHCAPGTCLHLGVRVGDRYVDPLLLVGPRTVVLLPTR